MIESVFAITNEPTKSATPPKTSRMYLKMFRKVFVSEESTFTCSDVVRTSTVGGNTERSSRTSLSAGVRGLAATSIRSYRPSLWNSFCAVGMSKIASVAPPKETPENLARPATRNFWIGPRAATPIVSPTWKWCFLAVPVSITTSSAPCGQCPATSVSGLKRVRLGSMPVAMFGAPPLTIAFPS